MIPVSIKTLECIILARLCYLFLRFSHQRRDFLNYAYGVHPTALEGHRCYNGFQGKSTFFFIRHFRNRVKSLFPIVVFWATGFRKVLRPLARQNSWKHTLHMQILKVAFCSENSSLCAVLVKANKV